MEYQMNSNADNSSPYLHECKDGWNSVPYELWSGGGSFGGPLANSASPIAPPFAPDCLSVEPIANNFSRTRTSSIVSPTVSSWSDSVVTPPVTPQKNERWYTLTPSEIALKPSTTPYLAVRDPPDVHVLEQDLWVPRGWHLPSLPPTIDQDPSRPHLDETVIDEDCTPMPFHSRANDPALSRYMFSDPMTSPTYRTLSSCRFDWSHVPPWSTPRTIAPKAIVQTTMASSPLAKAESPNVFKLESFGQSGIGLDSSPLPTLSPRVVPSQSSLNNFELLPDVGTTQAQPILTRQLCVRSNRRSQHRRTLANTTSKARKAMDDIACDAVIHPNTFACNFPGCIDKSTGKQKRFKRQEHRKRHEITVHKTKGDKKYICWVSGCHVGFNRTDNLKNHLTSTHGKNNPSRRNRYVATLDAASKYYNPTWQGKLTGDGYPLIEGVAIHPCSDCQNIYHLEEKLKAHLLQQHGKKPACSDASHIATSDESSDSPDRDRKARVTKHSSAGKKS